MSDTSGWNDSGSGWTGEATNAGVDQVTTTEHIGFGQRLMSSIAGVLIGLVLVVACGVALFWNEGRAVFTARALSEGLGLAVTAPADRVDPANEGKLVHVSGPATGADLRDADTGVAARGLRLVRHVEMYQWREHRDTQTTSNVGGSQTRTTTYRYTREWSDRPIDSGRFNQPGGHENPAMPLRTRAVEAEGARLGAFQLSPDVLSRLGDGQAFTVPDGAGGRFAGRAQVMDGRLYVGDPLQPRIGDLRIRYTLVGDGPVSLVANQRGQGFAAHRATNGETFLLARTGAHGSAAMFQRAQDDNRVLTWVIRAVALVFMFVGFFLLFAPFVTLADVIPLFGSIVAMGAGLIAFTMTLLVGGTTIAVAWLWYRPLLGAALIAGVIAAVYGLRVLAERRRARRAPPMPAQPAFAGAPPAYPQQPPASFLPPQHGEAGRFSGQPQAPASFIPQRPPGGR
jgi:hypothetical protein